MAKKYIARDPRTGKPIQVSQSTKADASYEPVQGPWCALHPDDIMSLAEGTLDQREVRWKNDTLTMSRQHGVRGLSHVPQHMIRPAHALLLKAFEDESPAVRIAALDVLPEFAVRRSDELFDWLSVLLDDEHGGVRKAASAALARDCGAARRVPDAFPALSSSVSFKRPSVSFHWTRPQYDI
ncbi:MAG: HEAT repeat domain-containing protein, partial [Poseidonia sp.]